MKYVITGSLGHISKPVTERLVSAKQDVTVITSKAENAKKIEAIGAKAAIGSVEDAVFIAKAFEGADVVYLMIPPNMAVHDWQTYLQKVADNYVDAVKSNHIKNVVLLSSVGAHLRRGTGPVNGLGYLEEKLGKSGDINLLMLRPSYFFDNLFSLAGLVKNAGIFGGNFGGKEKFVLTDTSEIAKVAADALLRLNFKGHTVQYISNDERTTDEIAKVLGEAIGKPGTPWVVFTDEQALKGMLDAGLPKTIAEGYTEMGHAINAGSFQEDYWKHRPAKMGDMKLEDFASRFAAAY